MPVSTPRALAFAPDPNKWIDTASIKSKSAKQRPLVALKDNCATPLARRQRDQRVYQDATPLTRQMSLSGYLTPPTSSQQPTRRLANLRKEGQAENPNPRGSPARDFASNSDRQLHAGPSKPREAVKRVAEISAASQSSPRRPRPKATATIAPPPASQSIRSSHLPRSRPNTSSPAPIHSDSPADLPTPTLARTPIPEHVLAIHRQLCGRDSQRMKGIKSPWRRDGESEGSPRPAKVRRKNVDSPSVPRKKAAERSDEEGEDPSRAVMRDLQPNARARVATNAAGPGTLTPVSNRRKRRPTKTTVEGEDIPMPPPRQPTPPSPCRQEEPMDIADPIPFNAMYPQISLELERSPSPVSLSPPERQHHQITPPKSRTPQKIREHNETLFAFPLPRQPRFVPEKEEEGKEEKRREWQPVEMDAETLLTWSLGGRRGSANESSAEQEAREERERREILAGLPPSDPPSGPSSNPPSDPLDLPPSDPPASPQEELPPSDPPAAPQEDLPPSDPSHPADLKEVRGGFDLPLSKERPSIKRKRINSTSSATESVSRPSTTF